MTKAKIVTLLIKRESELWSAFKFSEKIKKKNSTSLTKRVVDLNRAKWSAVHQLLNDLDIDYKEVKNI